MPWLNESEELEFEVLAVKRNSKGTGWVLEGEKLAAFAYNSNTELRHLLVALASWVDSGQGKAIKVHKEPKVKCGFVIKPMLSKGKPVAQQWRLTETGYAVVIEGLEPESNPFL